MTSPDVDSFKNALDEINFNFKVTHNNDGVGSVHTTLYIDGKKTASKNTRSSGNVEYIYRKHKTSEEIEVKLVAKKPGYENETYFTIVRNFYTITSTPQDDSIVTHERLILSTLFSFNGEGRENLEVRFFLNNQNIGEAFTQPNGACSLEIEDPKYGINKFYSILDLDGVDIQTETSTFTYLKDLSVTTYSINYAQLDNFTNPTILLQAKTYSYQKHIPGITVEFYINNQKIGSNVTSTDGVASINYKIHNLDEVEWYVIAHKENHLTDTSPTKTIDLINNIPSLEATVLHPKNMQQIQNHTIYTKLTVQILKDGLPEKNASVTFYIDDKPIGTSLTNITGIAIMPFLPKIENQTFNWMFEAKNNQGLTYHSDTHQFSTPLLAPDILIINSYSSESRCNVNDQIMIGFKIEWENGTILKNTQVRLNDGGINTTNDKGWVYFTVTSNHIENKTWFITSIFKSDYNKIIHLKKPKIIFDKVKIYIISHRERYNVGEVANLTIMGLYEYDNTTFIGETMCCVEPIKYSVGKKELYIIEIMDDIYNVTKFTSNKIPIIWDNVIITIEQPKDRIHYKDTYEPIINAYYQYDKTPYQGEIYYNQTPTYEQLGPKKITVNKINDTKYNLTIFESNTIIIYYDDIEITRTHDSFTLGKSITAFEARYITDNSPANITLISKNNDIYLSSNGIITIVKESLLPINHLDYEIKLDEYVIEKNSVNSIMALNFIIESAILFGSSLYAHAHYKKASIKRKSEKILTELNKYDVIKIVDLNQYDKGIKQHISERMNKRYILNYDKTFYISKKILNIGLHETKDTLLQKFDLKLGFIRLVIDKISQPNIKILFTQSILEKISNNLRFQLLKTSLNHVTISLSKNLLLTLANPLIASQNISTIPTIKSISRPNIEFIQPQSADILPKTYKLANNILRNTPNFSYPDGVSQEDVATMAPQLFPPVKGLNTIRPGVVIITDREIKKADPPDEKDKPKRIDKEPFMEEKTVDAEKENVGQSSYSEDEKDNLFRMLTAEKVSTRNIAAKQIMKLGLNIVPDLIRAHNSELFKNEWKIIQMIGRLGDKTSIPFLEEQLSNPDKRIRLFTKDAIRKIKRRESM